MLSESDRRAIQSVISRVKNLNQSTQQRAGVDLPNDGLYPEVYVAKTPPAGIPAISKDLNFGTSTGSGTGTLATSVGNTPGSGECSIYQVIITNNIPDLIDTDAQTKTVYNLQPFNIPGNTWVLITRDKFGSWFTSFTQDIQIIQIAWNPSEVGVGTGTGGGDILPATPDQYGYYEAKYVIYAPDNEPRRTYYGRSVKIAPGCAATDDPPLIYGHRYIGFYIGASSEWDYYVTPKAEPNLLVGGQGLDKAKLLEFGYPEALVFLHTVFWGGIYNISLDYYNCGFYFIYELDNPGIIQLGQVPANTNIGGMVAPEDQVWYGKKRLIPKNFPGVSPPEDYIDSGLHCESCDFNVSGSRQDYPGGPTRLAAYAVDGVPGGTKTTGGLNFQRGIYMSGEIIFPSLSITIGTTTVTGGSTGDLLGIGTGNTITAITVIDGGTF